MSGAWGHGAPLALRGSVSVLTGAGSGIGRACALALADRGGHLALTDRDAVGLGATAARARERGVLVSTYEMDVADTDAVAALPARVLDDHGRVTVLINNAGVSLVGRFADLTLAEFDWLLDINFRAVVGHTAAFLPVLARQPAAQIVNVSSLFGLIAPAEQTAYAASKFAVRGFSESLRHELVDSAVGVTVVHPGGIRTAIARSARVAAHVDQSAARASSDAFDQRFLRIPPSNAATAIVRAIERRRPRVLIGADARGGDLLARLAPARYWPLLRRVFDVTHI